MRGDNVGSLIFEFFFVGSPPHAWGQPDTCSRRRRCNRFTPTCVGTTSIMRLARTAIAVHPHMRGDNATQVCCAVAQTGSPPHAWGQLPLPSPQAEVLRFTPTCVGTTPTKVFFLITPPVHPHMRGDNARSLQASPAPFGSPPHAWGQRLQFPSAWLPMRFTPTCVGTTAKPGSIPQRPAVHPHMRGDNVSRGQWRFADAGSPPHAWGQHCNLKNLRPANQKKSLEVFDSPRGRSPKADIKSLFVGGVVDQNSRAAPQFAANFLPELFPHERGNVSHKNTSV